MGTTIEALNQLTFFQLIIFIVLTFGGIIATIFAIRVSLNWVDFLEYRRKIQKEKLRALCPHVEGVVSGKKVGVRSCFISPSGTLDSVCSRCGVVVHHVDEDEIRYWADNPKELLKREKRFQKAARKFYKV